MGLEVFMSSFIVGRLTLAARGWEKALAFCQYGPAPL
jgi:hypothetical protein